MAEKKDLMKLIEQAAATVSMMTPADLSDMDELRNTMDDIRKFADQSESLSDELAALARQQTSEASELLEKLASAEAEADDEAVARVSNCVAELQKLLDDVSALHEEDSTDAGEASTVPQGFVVPEEDVPLVTDFIAEANEHIEISESSLLELENKPDDAETLNKIFRAFHTIKGMAGFLNLTDIGSLAHSAENLLDLARKGELLIVDFASDVVFESIDMLKKMLLGLEEAVNSSSPVPASPNLAAMIERIVAASEGESSTTQTTEPAVAEATDVKADSSAAESVVESNSPTRNRTHITEEKIKVSTSRLDNLVNMVGELVIAQLMVAEEVNTNLAAEFTLTRKVAHQSKIVRELQELSMSMRMVPISGVFQKMARLVRDLSKKASKDIEFVTVGEETELDRTIVDKIADPLVHMIRNSVDHGIEAADARQTTGKSAKGRIELRAFHQAGNIVIEIEDDGKGLDKARILKKAIDNGVVTADQELTDDEIYKLIFHPGLSTAEKVTSVSGRGVGMDVVKKNIEALRGRIDISTSLGKGTIFTIRLPLTLAIIDGQVIRVGNTKYIIPINSIVHSLRPKAEQLSTVQNRGETAIVRDDLMPMIRLYKMFGIEPSTEDATRASLVVVEDDGRKCCLLVDELLEQQQVVIKSLGTGLGKVKGISGGAIMGDGRVSLILDVPGIIDLSRQ